MTSEQAKELLDGCANKIGEHFDAVQILATRMVGEKTHSLYRGVGNWHARQGMAHEFIVSEVASEHAVEIAKRLGPESS